MRNVYFTVSRNSAAYPYRRSYLSESGSFIYPTSSNTPPGRFPTLQDAVHAVAALSLSTCLDGLRIERHVEEPRPAIEILEDLAGVVEDSFHECPDFGRMRELIAEATDRINQGSA